MSRPRSAKNAGGRKLRQLVRDACASRETAWDRFVERAENVAFGSPAAASPPRP